MGEPELGYVSLIELRTVRDKLGLPIERDLHFEADRPISAYADEARSHGHDQRDAYAVFSTDDQIITVGWRRKRSSGEKDDSFPEDYSRSKTPVD